MKCHKLAWGTSGTGLDWAGLLRGVQGVGVVWFAVGLVFFGGVTYWALQGGFVVVGDASRLDQVH